MVNTEPLLIVIKNLSYYNILNIVVNTELVMQGNRLGRNYNILNIVVNTEQYTMGTPFFFTTPYVTQSEAKSL